MLQRICLTVEYDGTDFCGWQRQRGRNSVQGALEAALGVVTGETPQALRLACAGRTDAGVHAAGQLCSFLTHDARPARRLAPAINHALPANIRVHLARAVPVDFDVRRASVAKWYSYRLYLGPHPSPLLGRRSWHLRRPLAIGAMREAAQALLGEHDFESFRSAHCDAAHARRNLMALRFDAAPWPPNGTIVAVQLVGNAFCRHMCRIIVGTLVEVGLGTRPAHCLRAVLCARDRRAAGLTAPPHGLTLQQIYLPGEPGLSHWTAPEQTDAEQTDAALGPQSSKATSTTVMLS